MEQADKIELIVDVCEKCANILKDPTLGGTVELSADARAKQREDAYDDLLVSVQTLAAIAEFNHSFYDVLNIAEKFKNAKTK